MAEFYYIRGGLKYGSIMKVWIRCMMCNGITFLFWFCFGKKEIYNRITLSFNIFFEKKNTRNMWFHCYYLWRNHFRSTSFLEF